MTSIIVLIPRGCFVNGQPQPSGARIPLPATEAYLGHCEGWGVIEDANDVARAGREHRVHVARQLRDLRQRRAWWRDSPWQKVA